MKKMNIAITVVVAVICVIGWLSLVGGEVSQNNQYSEAVTQADAWVEEGLYQRAILKYQEAIAQEPDPALYDKAIAAYQMRMAEVSGEVLEDTTGEYTDFLKAAAAQYPGMESYANLLGSLLIGDEDYEDAYNVLHNAVENGVESTAVLDMLYQARYATDYRGSTYSQMLTRTGSTYSVKRTGLWGSYSPVDGTVLACEYSYVSQSNPEGVQVLTSEKDSRLVNGEGLVMGIFEKKVTDAGLFAEGLIPASFDGVTYDYYDEYARKQFGGYEMAGTFCDGKAAVKQNGLWFLIDEKGNKISDVFEQIVLTNDRSYLAGEFILASQSQGTYTIYDKDMKAQNSFEAEAVDVLTADGLVAFCSGGRWGYVNMEGQVVIDPYYTQARSFSNGLAAVCMDQWGFIDPAGTQVISEQFADALYFDAEGYCPVRLDVEPEEPVDATEEPQAPADTEEPQAPADTEEPQAPADAQEPDGSDDAADEAQNGSPEEWRLLKLMLGIVED